MKVFSVRIIFAVIEVNLVLFKLGNLPVGEGFRLYSKKQAFVFIKVTKYLHPNRPLPFSHE